MTDTKNSTLRKVYDASILGRDETSKINLKHKTRYGKSQILFENREPIVADSSGSFTRDTNERDGWYYTNTDGGDKFNLYYFDGLQENIKLKDIRSLWTRMTIDNYQTNPGNIPFFVIYTKPTGVGDTGPFYHSRISYEFSSDQHIGIGEECVFYALEQPRESLDNRKVIFNLKNVLGDGLPDEEVFLISLQSNSGASSGQVQVLIDTLGFEATIPNARIHRNLNLIGHENDHVFHDKIMDNQLILSGETYTSEKILINTLTGLIGWQIQGTGSVNPNQWTVLIGIRMDDTYYESVTINSQFIERYSGTQSIYGNIKDIKPKCVRLRITNNNQVSEQFTAWVSHG